MRLEGRSDGDGPPWASPGRWDIGEVDEFCQLLFLNLQAVCLSGHKGGSTEREQELAQTAR